MTTAAASRRTLDVNSQIEGRAWPPAFRPVISKLVADRRQYFGSESIDLEPVRQLERPFSTLLEIRVFRDSGPQNAFVKILKPRGNTPDQIASMRQNVVKDFEMTARVHHGLASYSGLTAVRPIACFPEHLAIVTEQAQGLTLAALLGRAAGWPGASAFQELSTTMRRVGAWLRAAQAVLPQEREISPEAVRTYLDTRLSELGENGPLRLTRAGRTAIESYRDRLLSETGRQGFPAVWIHADFCPENIVASKGWITVLDFTMAKSGTVYHDVAHLFFRLDSMKAKPWFRRAVIERLQHELLDSFEPGLGSDRPLFALMVLQHLICHLVTQQAALGHGRLGRLFADRLHARDRQWLAEVARVLETSWVK
jgi:hypothetical protein